MSATPVEPSLPPEMAEYRSLGIVSFGMGEGQELVYSEWSGVARLMSVADADVLTACDAFRTLDHHAREMCRRWELPADRVGPVLYQLVQFAKAGLLVPLPELLERCPEEGGTAAASPPIERVVVMACGRADALERTLSSLMESARARGRPAVFEIRDDCPETGSGGSIRGMAAGLGKRFGCAVRCSGSEERGRIRNALVRAGGLTPETIDFALLDPERGGAAFGSRWNTLLLSTPGERFVCVEEGSAWRSVADASPDSFDLVLSSEEDPSEERPHVESAPSAGGFLDDHEQWLGRSVSAAVAVVPPARIDLRAMDARFLRMLKRGRGRVRLTRPGERTAAGAVRAARRLTLGNRPSFTAVGAGFDHREILPPFFPLTRVDGGLFAAILLKSFDRDCIGHLPWAMTLPGAADAPEIGVSGERMRFREVLSACMASFEPGPAMAEGSERLRALGRHLEDLGSLPRPEFEEIVRKMYWLGCSRRIDRLEAQAKAEQTVNPDRAAQIRRSVTDLLRVASRAESLAPVDLPGENGESAARERSPGFVARYGRLLRHWPEMVEAARDHGRKAEETGGPP